MKRILQTVGVLAFALMSVGSAQAILMSTLLAGGSITAGDKVFDQWTQLSYVTGDGRTFNPSNINVTALSDGGLDPGPGLLFTINDAEMSVTGDGIFNFIDLAFGFHVSAGPGFAVKDNSLLGLAGFLNTSSANGLEDTGMTIQEWVGNAFVTNPATLGFIKTEFSALNGAVTFPTDASSTFAPQAGLFVTKDILVWATNSLENANLQGFTQRFSQQAVPEPGTLTLLVLSLAGLGFSRRRKN